METKVTMPEKIVPYKCCKDFYTDYLTDVSHFQVLSATFIEYGQNVNKHNIL